VLKSEADGCIGGEFNGISMSGAGRLFAHYSNGVMRALADIQFTGEESWLEGAGEDWTRAAEIRAA
jgi:flagellar hook protein FlgE